MPVASTAQLDSPRVKQLSDGNSSGTVLGTGSTDLISFYNATPIVQPSGNAQAAVTRGQACGMVFTVNSIQSPSAVQAQTTAEASLTLMGATAPAPVAAADLIIVNKPTSQAGLTVGNVRGKSPNTIGVNFGNMTGTSITPTASEAYGVIALRGFAAVTAALTPAAVGISAIVEQQFTVTGIRAGELIQVNKPTNQAGLDIVGCRAVSNNLVGISFMNNTLATVTPTAAETYTFTSLGGIDAVSNELSFQIAASPTTILAAPTITEYLMPVTGLVLGDAAKSVTKPTLGSTGIVGARVSVPSTIGVQFVAGVGTTTTPTAGEVYYITITRENPAAPLLLYTQALSPTSVPGGTSAEQTFTVAGLIASTPVWVNKPSAQPNLGIAGVRVSAANTLAINFVNTSANSILPTAAEVYTIGNFQMPLQTGGVNAVGNTVGQLAVGVTQQTAVLANAERAALVNTGLIAGA